MLYLFRTLKSEQRFSTDKQVSLKLILSIVYPNFNSLKKYPNEMSLGKLWERNR